MVTTRSNISPALALEMINRIAILFKDYCGVLTEEAIRKNFVLLYEILDEVIDFGYPQNSSTEHLKSFIFNKPAPVAAPTLTQAKDALTTTAASVLKTLRLQDMAAKTAPSTAIHKSVVSDSKTKRNEIFVDIVERVSVTFSSSGYSSQSMIDGRIQMKSFLAGNPELRLALNEELVIGKRGGTSRYGVVELDDCNFHDCVRLDEWDEAKVMAFQPPDGEFVLMNYRMTSAFRAPFRVFPFIELRSPYVVEVVLKIRADIPEQNHGSKITIEFPVPKDTTSVSHEWGHDTKRGSTKEHLVEYIAKDKKVVWRVKKWPGGQEFSLRLKLNLTASRTSGNAKKELGPVSMEFEVPMYNVSGLQVRYLRIMLSDTRYNPYRWVRYVTKSSSYVCRV